MTDTVKEPARDSASQERRTRYFGRFLLLVLWIGAIEVSSFVILNVLQSRYRTLVYDSSYIQVADVTSRGGYDARLGWIPKGDLDEHGARVDTSGHSYATACVEMYGDSFTWSDEVQGRHAWPNDLSGFLGCRVLNFGVGGYGSDQALLRYLGNQRHADIAVLNHLSENIMRNANQLRNLIYPGKQLALKPRFVLEKGTLKYVSVPEVDVNQLDQAATRLVHEFFVPDGKSGIRSEFTFPYTYTLLGMATGHYRISARLRGEPAHARFYDADHPAGGLELTSRIVGRFVAEARAKGQIPLITIIPMCKDLKFAEIHGVLPHQSLVQSLKDQGIEVFDFSAAFRERADFESLYIDCRGHLNKAGYRFMATTFARYLEQKGLVPKAQQSAAYPVSSPVR
ncbi:MAG: hypothetical protein AAF441_11220 [Pseudomonadota bacterium]